MVIEIGAERTALSEGLGVVHAFPLPTVDGLNVNIRGEIRIPHYTDAVTLPEKVFEQASTVGKELFHLAEGAKSLMENRDIRNATGLRETLYESMFKPFTVSDNATDVLGADAILDERLNIKLIEINSRPQFLGRYDAVTPIIIGQDDPNSRVSSSVAEAIQNRTRDGTKVVVVSHPLNAFHEHHKLFAAQAGISICTLQDLHTDHQGRVLLDHLEVGLIFRQFNMRNLLQPEITEKGVLESIQKGRVQMINGVTADFIKLKGFFPLVKTFCPKLTENLPEMVSVNVGEEIHLKDYQDWWLKGDAQGDMEFVIQLTRQNLQSWPGQVIRSIVAGDINRAEKIIEPLQNNTANRFKSLVGVVFSFNIRHFLKRIKYGSGSNNENKFSLGAFSEWGS